MPATLSHMSQVEKQLDETKAQIESEIPDHISVTDVKYEGPELVVYTRDPNAPSLRRASDTEQT